MLLDGSGLGAGGSKEETGDKKHNFCHFSVRRLLVCARREMQLFVNKDGHAQCIVKKKVTGCKTIFILCAAATTKGICVCVCVCHKEAQVTKCLQCQFGADIFGLNFYSDFY